MRKKMSVFAGWEPGELRGLARTLSRQNAGVSRPVLLMVSCEFTNALCDRKSWKMSGCFRLGPWLQIRGTRG